MRVSRLLVISWCTTIGLVGVARADEPTPVATETTPTSAPAQPPASQLLAIPKGGFVVNLFVDIAIDSTGPNPISVSPDIWYGITDDLTVGIVHSFVGSTGFFSSPSLIPTTTSLCVAGQSNGCANVYNNVGADVRYRLMEPLTVDGGVYLFDVSTSAVVTIKLGVDIRKRWSKIVLEAQPSIFIALNNRSDGAAAMGMTPADPGRNEQLYIPVTVSYDVSDKMDVALQTGLGIISLSRAGDFYSVPFGAAYRYHFNRNISAGIAFTFPDLVSNNGTADARSLTIGATYAK
jgi:hypothetical protein